MTSAGLGDDPAQIAVLLLATCYGLVARSNAAGRVYRDAHLAAGATDPDGGGLPDPVRRRIRDVMKARDPLRTRAALDELLGWQEPTGDEAALTGMILDGILRHGVELVRRRGHEGLYEFLGRADAWFRARIRKGDQGPTRGFLRRFAFECKVSFYLCYANAWIGLIPWLREHRGLDPTSERFLGFWHMQNRPVPGPDGRATPDAFRGHVLGLHPLSGFFMKDPALCAVAGRFFATDAYDEALTRGRAGACAAYWSLVGAILTAAALYRQALDGQDPRRGRRARGSAATCPSAESAPERTEARLLEDFAAHTGLRCTGCGGDLRFEGLTPPEGPTPTGVEVAFACRRCGAGARHRLDRSGLSAWLLSPE
jgi:hypothetical protein